MRRRHQIARCDLIQQLELLLGLLFVAHLQQQVREFASQVKVLRVDRQRVLEFVDVRIPRGQKFAGFIGDTRLTASGRGQENERGFFGAAERLPDPPEIQHKRAFAWPRARAVALLINSPGGSAVQSHLIFQRIRALAAEKNLRVFAAVEDVAASGGYMMACSADEIVCDPASIVGSIGVIGASFGFTEAIRKLGVERRIYTAGENNRCSTPSSPKRRRT